MIYLPFNNVEKLQVKNNEKKLGLLPASRAENVGVK
tara:strand:- start:101 stop:208 length:108 start_codon:yes stop_codon:yes gene_type:complete